MILRYEFKVPCDATLLLEAEAWVRLHPAHWRVSFPPRQVNNIYFDSPDHHDLNANLSGTARRDKLRLRWYGPELTQVRAGQLELKRKDGMAGWKEILPFSGTLDLVQRPWSTQLADLREGVEARGRLWLDKRSTPVLINCYQRAYYETPDGVVRLTLDTGLRAYDQRISLAPNLGRLSHQSAQIVVELKGPMDDESYRRLSRILMTLPMRSDRFSKYLRGVLAAPEFDGVLI